MVQMHFYIIKDWEQTLQIVRDATTVDDDWFPNCDSPRHSFEHEQSIEVLFAFTKIIRGTGKIAPEPLKTDLDTLFLAPFNESGGPWRLENESWGKLELDFLGKPPREIYSILSPHTVMVMQEVSARLEFESLRPLYNEYFLHKTKYQDFEYFDGNEFDKFHAFAAYWLAAVQEAAELRRSLMIIVCE